MKEGRTPATRFAVWPVWATMRLLWWLAVLCVPGSTIWLFMGGGAGTVLLLWTIGLLVTLNGGRRHYRPDASLPMPPFRVSFVLDALGRRFVSDACPDCGHSCFDHAPPTVYASDLDRQAQWPVRCCANCGRDLTKP